MQELFQALQQLESKRILVLGDLMLDTYTRGEVSRISPEAPVPILRVTDEESLPGGAGNVALNLKALGAEVFLGGRVGKDRAAGRLKKALEGEGIQCSGVVEEEGFQTPVKNRMMASGQQMLRVDYEEVQVLSEEAEEQWKEKVLPHLLEKVDVVAISDYAKGFLSEGILKAVIERCGDKQIPVLVDPKGRDFSKYAGATLIKPNYGESLLASGLESTASVREIAGSLLKKTGIETLVMTRSYRGISVFQQQGKQKDFPVQVREVQDVTGAGDTVLAMLTLGIASRLPMDHIIQLANFAAGRALEKVGCARVTKKDLEAYLLSF